MTNLRNQLLRAACWIALLLPTSPTSFSYLSDDLETVSPHPNLPSREHVHLSQVQLNTVQQAGPTASLQLTLNPATILFSR